MQTWVHEELATADLGDRRLTRRFHLLLDRMAQKPSLKFPAACRGRAEVEAAYRFLDHDAVDAPSVLAPHRDATLRRVREHPVVIVAQDTTELDLTRKHERMAGAGPLNDASRLGLYDHVLLAMTPAKLVLGVVAADVWARDADAFGRSAQAKRAERKAKPIEGKESHRWLEGYRQACQLAQEAPATTVISVSDSEGDVYECLQEGRPAPGVRQAEWIIRACQDRALAPAPPADGAALPASLRARVAATAVLRELEVRVSRREPTSKDGRKRKQPRAARTARLTVQAARVTLRGPARPGGRLADEAVNVVLVREPRPPAGEEPVEWLLLTGLPIDTAEQVTGVIDSYCCRWQIEVYFRVLKSGCKVEESQLETAGRFLPYLGLCMIVAWRVLYALTLGRECPELPCDEVFEADEWRAVYAVVKGEAPPATAPPLGEMVKLIASLGGYLGRACDGEPGPKAMWVGLQRMADLARAWRAAAEQHPPPKE